METIMYGFFVVILLLIMIGLIMTIFSAFSPIPRMTEEEIEDMNIQYGGICRTCKREWVDKEEAIRMTQGYPIECGECETFRRNIEVL